MTDYTSVYNLITFIVALLQLAVMAIAAIVLVAY